LLHDFSSRLKAGDTERLSESLALGCWNEKSVRNVVQDANQPMEKASGPQSSALPGCATPRTLWTLAAGAAEAGFRAYHDGSRCCRLARASAATSSLPAPMPILESVPARARLARPWAALQARSA